MPQNARWTRCLINLDLNSFLCLVPGALLHESACPRASCTLTAGEFVEPAHLVLSHIRNLLGARAHFSARQRNTWFHRVSVRAACLHMPPPPPPSLLLLSLSAVFLPAFISLSLSFSDISFFVYHHLALGCEFLDNRDFWVVFIIILLAPRAVVGTWEAHKDW